MKSNDTPKTHQRKFSVAQSQQKGIQKPNMFNKVPDSPAKIAAREKLKALQAKNNK